MNNTQPEYWQTIHDIEENASRILAYIAGDYANMQDSEVFATLINEISDKLEHFTEREEY